MSPEELAVARASEPAFPSEARELLEYGAEREGYWTSEKFMAQIERAALIAEHKYTPAMHTIVWLFDRSSCHKAYTPDALNATQHSRLCTTLNGQGVHKNLWAVTVCQKA